MGFGTGENIKVDNTTIGLNSSNELYTLPLQPRSIIYNSNTTLTQDIYAFDITINSGITLTTNGNNLICNGTFDNSLGGTVNTGVQSSGGGTGGTGTGGSGSYGLYLQASIIKAGTITSSGQNGIYTSGPSGMWGGCGGGGGGVIIFSYGISYTFGTYNILGGIGSNEANSFGGIAGVGGIGGNDNVTGGAGGSNTPTVGGNGNSNILPSLTNSLINNWYIGGFNNYLSGTGGGGGSSNGTTGGNGTSISTSYGGTGGGGGGTSTSAASNGGNGGNGVIGTYQYSIPPIPLYPLFTFTTYNNLLI